MVYSVVRLTSLGLHLGVDSLAYLPAKLSLFVQTRAEAIGTGVFSPLNTVHVQYRGLFVEQYKCTWGCCGIGLKEVCRLQSDVVVVTDCVPVSADTF